MLSLADMSVRPTGRCYISQRDCAVGCWKAIWTHWQQARSLHVERLGAESWKTKCSLILATRPRNERNSGRSKSLQETLSVSSQWRRKFGQCLMSRMPKGRSFWVPTGMNSLSWLDLVLDMKMRNAKCWLLISLNVVKLYSYLDLKLKQFISHF